VIVQVAAFRREKAHHDSIEALSILCASTSLRPYLLFVGGGRDAIINELRGFAKARSVEEQVRFCGVHPDVRHFYWIADVFTLTSTAVETFSLAALEAMSTGLPCVLTDLGGAAEMVSDGGNGYLVLPGRPDLLADAWARALRGDLVWPSAQIRENVVKRFELATCVRAYEDALVPEA
jgi:glycosyltransferase involved in cell wall biosynthesis